MKRVRAGLVLAAVLGGCGSSPMMAVPPVDTTPHIDLASTPYTLQPGEEKYYCYAMHLPADQDIVITRLVPTYGEGTHHILFSQALATEPEGFSDCNVLIKNTWVPLYAGGKNSGPLSPPTGSAFKLLQTGQQVVMQLHLQNASQKPITGTTTMRIEYAAASSSLLSAGIFGYDDRMLSIPAHSAAAVNTMSCKMDRDLDVFAVLGHMHKHGTHLSLSRGAAPGAVGAEMLFDTTWNFDVQPVTPAKLSIKAGDTVYLQCTHENSSSAPLMYGESSDTEMCAAVFYYTGFDHVNGCVQ